MTIFAVLLLWALALWCHKSYRDVDVFSEWLYVNALDIWTLNLQLLIGLFYIDITKLDELIEK